MTWILRKIQTLKQYEKIGTHNQEHTHAGCDLKKNLRLKAYHHKG